MLVAQKFSDTSKQFWFQGKFSEYIVPWFLISGVCTGVSVWISLVPAITLQLGLLQTTEAWIFQRHFGLSPICRIENCKEKLAVKRNCAPDSFTFL